MTIVNGKVIDVPNQHNIIIVDDFLSTRQCEWMIEEAIEMDCWEADNDPFWDSKSFNPETVQAWSKYYSNLMIKATQDVSDIIQDREHIRVYADCTTVNRWHPDSFQPPHCDNMSEWPEHAPNHKHRLYGSIIYLNDNFDGGCTYYPNFNIEIVPRTGSLVIHPGDINHLHGVSTVKDSTRYTMSSFWTNTEDKINRFIHKEEL